MGKDVQTAIRLDPAQLARLDELAKFLSSQTGLDVTRAAAMRRALEVGLDALLPAASTPSRARKSAR